MTTISNPSDVTAEQAAGRLARQITAEREARGWTQATLAGRAGVSKAAVSRIERGEMSPTAVTLLRLAGAFDLTLAGLLLRAEGAGAREHERLSRAAQQPEWRDPDTGYTRRQLFAAPTHPLEAVQVTLPAGASVTLPASSYAHIAQVLWVQSGELCLTERRTPDLTWMLAAGDGLGFGTPCDVTFENPGTQPCMYAVFLARR
ncbi:XRE family transcriptional regulator [Deinococcus soli (ex Cha et al. 2016)]|uniref:Transcriptional regulator with XRE-family HTH domain n=2 Tax=Deinococcus soli (ex Cha et al. 2016) TaxID=1309411 RepID=A0AAE3XEW1_9DEIO|nr:XRE family transcriptional regulator [Deinococcus soli (ex Cha et al. 2016)]MDR6220152.1 transcriptional regulator with XRE-family HTH domain [Deinococcus soli (ex Cha et al. 2016)]MDR6330007.1 transcriptional regulator with XRE-family HTH domain [Deinococcus soli (ex Cha et al. 2016)]MDR6753362.1 transcriptional regulator with XRE-family HTH domain [Deinococcus soli (ex Cha et al. 2016)]